MNREQLSEMPSGAKYRYVIFSEKNGIFLGEGVWSKDKTASTKNFAPTYEKDVDLTTFKQAAPDVKLCYVFPSLAGDHASQKDLNNVGLPSW